MAIKLAVVGLATMAVGGLLSLIVTWWSSPLDRVNMNPFGTFDERDLVPLGYAAFAFVLGVTAGVLIRRALPAMATTLVAFVAVRGVINKWVRPYLLAPVQVTAPDNQLTGTGNAPTGAGVLNPHDWIISNQTINGAGRVIGQNGCSRAGRGDQLEPHGQRHGSGERVVSGGDRDSEQLRCPDLPGNRLAVGPQADDVDPDRLDGPLPALLKGAAPGEAPGQCRDGHVVPAALLGLNHDRVGVHRLHCTVSHSTDRSSSAVMPAWLRIDRSRPGPMVSPACRGTVTRPPRAACLSWA